MVLAVAWPVTGIITLLIHATAHLFMIQVVITIGRLTIIMRFHLSPRHRWIRHHLHHLHPIHQAAAAAMAAERAGATRSMVNLQLTSAINFRWCEICYYLQISRTTHHSPKRPPRYRNGPFINLLTCQLVNPSTKILSYLPLQSSR